MEGCSGTTPYYFGAIWTYQGYPYYNEAGPQNALAVSAGDTLSVSVFYNAAKNWVVFKVADLTTGTYYQQPLSNVNESYYPSAEVVTYGNIANQGTADFGHVGFSQISVLGTLQHQRVSMADPAFKVIRVEQKGPVTGLADVLPGVLASTATESSFANAWLRAN